MHDLVPDEAPTTGLAAALRERQGAAQAAEAEDAARGAEGAAAPGAAPGAELGAQASDGELRAFILLGWSYLDAWMMGWTEGKWTGPHPELRAAGVDAACRLAAQFNVPNPPPHVTLMVVLAIGYGPPLIAGWKLKRARGQAQRDGEDDPRS